MFTRFTIDIFTENAAFKGMGDEGIEVARILHEVAKRLETGASLDTVEGGVRDYNGNTVGKIEVEGEEN